MTKQFQQFDHVMGYFKVEGENGLEERTFHIVKGRARTREFCTEFVDNFQKALEEALPDQAEIHWRIRPEFSQEKDRRISWRFTVYMRVTTHPELPDTFWKKWESKEGQYKRLPI